MNATTLGIPCFYYGTEQHLDGSGGGTNADRYIREAMFGGEFGPFRAGDRHVFDEIVGRLPDADRSAGATPSREPPSAVAGSTCGRSPATVRCSVLPTGFGGPLLGVIGLVPDPRRPGGALR